MGRSLKVTPPLRPHRIALKSTHALPRHWLGNGCVNTHLVNALGIIFPTGERFFVRTAREALPGLVGAKLIADTRGFIAQEMHHAAQHERAFALLEQQGLPAARMAEVVDKVVRRGIEPLLPMSIRMAVTAALEHYTATLAEFAFATPLFDEAPPMMRELFLWHSAEEIEHKCVAFDLLQVVAPSYGVRLLGLVIGTALLALMWAGTTIALLTHERPRAPWAWLRELGTAVEQERFPGRTLLAAIRTYLKRDFHPSDEDNFHRARAFFAARGPDGEVLAVHP